MINPILNGISNPMLTQAKQIMGVLRNANNPQELAKQMMSNNPQYKQVMDYIKANGNDPKEAFYKMAKEKGVDPNEILNALK